MSVIIGPSQREGRRRAVNRCGAAVTVTVTVLDPVACCFKFDSYATIDLPVPED